MTGKQRSPRVRARMARRGRRVERDAKWFETMIRKIEQVKKNMKSIWDGEADV